MGVFSEWLNRPTYAEQEREMQRVLCELEHKLCELNGNLQKNTEQAKRNNEELARKKQEDDELRGRLHKIRDLWEHLDQFDHLPTEAQVTAAIRKYIGEMGAL